MTVIEIIKHYLKANGYDGLAGNGCGCGLDDLAPCCIDTFGDCKPAYLCKEPVCERTDEWPGEPLYCTRRKGPECKEGTEGCT